ncbi:MAG: hypothetical protein J3R72DRAFT_112876 [Linnemannia gamsii]|nr:MAG: hypothetical protein J3R72DRAFT_112876 [Linnemannia gamsii]
MNHQPNGSTIANGTGQNRLNNNNTLTHHQQPQQSQQQHHHHTHPNGNGHTPDNNNNSNNTNGNSYPTNNNNNSSANGNGNNNNNNNRSDDQGAGSPPDQQNTPQRRKKASRACFHCQKAHLTCDDCKWRERERRVSTSELYFFFSLAMCAQRKIDVTQSNKKNNGYITHQTQPRKTGAREKERKKSLTTVTKQNDTRKLFFSQHSREIRPLQGAARRNGTKRLILLWRTGQMGFLHALDSLENVHTKSLTEKRGWRDIGSARS